MTGGLLNRLTHHVSIREMNGDSYRLGQSRADGATTKPNPKPSPIGLTGQSAQATASYVKSADA